tara:strand:+ start:133 stop:582 length:450 start_codon:yes stop_codon:yes gene_type:complete
MKCVAVFQNKLKGFVLFEQKSDYVLVSGIVEGLQKNSLHGIHIHEHGDLRNGCESACAHFNPFNKDHGGREDVERHVGDLGNIETDNQGIAHFKFKDKIISLKNNKRNIIGRSVVIHKDRDDLGKGGDKESLKTGNAGKRLDCAVIGIC